MSRYLIKFSIGGSDIFDIEFVVPERKVLTKLVRFLLLFLVIYGMACWITGPMEPSYEDGDINKISNADNGIWEYSEYE